MTSKIKKKIILNIPYFAVGLFCTNLGEAWRIAWGSNMSEKVQGLILYGGFKTAFANFVLQFISKARMPRSFAMEKSMAQQGGENMRI